MKKRVVGAGGSMLPEDIHVFKLPLLFPLNPVNVYFISGDIPTLIDTGMDTDIAREKLVGGLKGLGYDLVDIKRIVLTHGHIDHFGLLGRICEHASPEILVHPGDEFRISAGIDDLIEKIHQNPRRFISMGIPERDVGRLSRNYINILRRFYVPVEGFSLIHDGDVIDLGHLSLEVVHTPGHTEGSICLINVDDKTHENSNCNRRFLFCGDQIMTGISTIPLPDITLAPGMEGVPYLDSMRRIAGLAPDIILSGHGEIIDASPGYMELFFRYHEDLSGRIDGVLGDIADYLTPMEVCLNLFPGITLNQCQGVVFGVFSYLHSLEGEGRVLSKERDGKIYFKGI